MPDLSLTVITDPVAKARPRITIRNGKAHGYTPTKTANAEWRIRAAFLERFAGWSPISGPLEVHVTAFLKAPASISRKRRVHALPTTRPDCDNYLKTVLDALNGVAFIDDSQVITASISKRYAKPGDSPWWFITIHPTVTPMAQPAAIPGAPEHATDAIRPSLRTP